MLLISSLLSHWYDMPHSGDKTSGCLLVSHGDVMRMLDVGSVGSVADYSYVEQLCWLCPATQLFGICIPNHTLK